MREPRRLSEIDEAARTAQLLIGGVEALDRPWPSQAQVSLQLAERLEQVRQPRHFQRWVLATAVVVVVIGLGTFLVTRPSQPGTAGAGTISLGAEGSLEVSANGAIDLPPVSGEVPGRRVVLKSGNVCAEVAPRDLARQGPLLVEAPHLKVVVIGTHFCVSTAGGVSTVSVTKGRVRAESPSGGSVFVGAGESVRSDDGRLSATPVTPASAAPSIAPSFEPARAAAEALPATPACGNAHSVEARRACYARVALGHDMAAQNALYGLGLLERDDAHDSAAALAAWQLYEERFPQGVFVPETALAGLGELLTQKRYPEALRETTLYLATGDDSAKDRVELVRAQLLLGSSGQPDQALPLLRRIVDAGDTALREEALFALGACQQALGRQEEAAATFRRSLTDYPTGIHAAEIRSRMQ